MLRGQSKKHDSTNTGADLNTVKFDHDAVFTIQTNDAKHVKNEIAPVTSSPPFKRRKIKNDLVASSCEYL